MKQGKLLEVESNWEKEWKDMPEYNQVRFDPVRTITICFKNEEDIEKFAKCIGQKIYPMYNNYWYPKLNMPTRSGGKYEDEP